MKKTAISFLTVALTFSTILLAPKGNEALAASKKVDKVKFGTNIQRSFNDDGYDYFHLNLKNNQSIHINLKDTKKKDAELYVISGVNVNSFKKHLAKLEDDELEDFFDEFEELYNDLDDRGDDDDDKKFKGFMKNVKVETILDTDRDDDDSIGQRKTDIGLKKGDYIVIAMTDDDDDYSKKYNLAITKSKKKNLEIESNDTFSKSASLTKGQTYQSTVFTPLDKADFYKVTVPEAGNLVVQSTTKKKADMSYTIYDSKKKKLSKTVKKSGKTYTTQAAVKKGIYYVRVTSDMSELDDLILNYNLKVTVKTKTPKATIINKKGTSKDVITVTGLKKGAKVIVYKDAKKKTIIATKTATTSTMKINMKKLTDRGGKVYVTVKNKALSTSYLKAVNYKAVK